LNLFKKKQNWRNVFNFIKKQDIVVIKIIDLKWLKKKKKNLNKTKNKSKILKYLIALKKILKKNKAKILKK
jgi:hypothetical protein